MTAEVPSWSEIQKLRQNRTNYSKWANTCSIEMTLRVVTPILCRRLQASARR